MLNLYDIAYGTGLLLSAPFWLIKGSARRKVFGALRGRMGQVPSRSGAEPAVLIHAVSLGEMNATRALVEALSQARAELRFIITTTTETGLARGKELYGGNERVTLVRYPLDFTAAVVRVLERLRPSVAVLMELEVWPNFIHQCARRGIPVLLVNGRLTSSSYRNYRIARPLVRGMFRGLSAVCVQDRNYAERFRELGAAPERVRITGTMKFDTAQVADRVEGDEALARDLDLRPSEEPIWVCGSTGPGEEELVIEAYRQLRVRHPSLRLAIIPRHPQRFDAVAKMIESSGFPLRRRSQRSVAGPQSSSLAPVILGDTMGELRKFYSLATVVFVGRSLVDLGPRQHGSDMIEPAALAKPVVVGPFTGNFADAVARLREADAVREVQNGEELGRQIDLMLGNLDEARAMGHRAQRVVVQQQGATERHVRVILEHLPVATTQGGGKSTSSI